VAITVTHPFVSAISDDPAAAAAGQVVPSNWNATHSLSGTLDVANGGTGVTTSTGSGSVVLSTGPTFSPDVVISGSSAGNALRITQTGSGNAFLVEDDTNVDASPFVIDSNGIVNIGLTGVTSSNLVVASTAEIIRGANRSDFALKRANTSLASPSIVASGDSLGQLMFQGYDGASYVTAGFIRGEVDGTPGTNDMPGRLVFNTTADGASSPTERMRITNAGNVLVGRTYTGTERIGIGGGTSTISSGTGAAGLYNDTIVNSAQTSHYDAHSTYIGTEAATFTISNLRHYRANQQPLGASSVITNQLGFVVDGGLTGATNNFGFYSNLASATGRWNFYANGTAANYFAGNTGIGGLPTTDTFRISGTASGSTFVNGQVIDQTIGSGVTSSYRGLLVRPIMQNAAFTLNTLYHVYVNPQTKPAAATLNNQYGFMAETTITDATSNYGFFGNMAAATGRWNFYGGGTAANHFSGTLSIGTPAVTYGLEVNRSLSGGVERYQVLVSGEIQSSVTTLATGVYVLPTINNSAFTLATYRGFQPGSFNISGAATITNYHGFFHGAVTQTNITTAYGYTSNLAASGSSRWNFYAGGTAPNYFAGDSTFNTGLTVNGTTNLSALTASTALALDSSKNIVSVTNTGSGDNVLATSPTLITPNLGTPSAITLTNATGTASININGTVGATTPTTGAFTTLSASSLGLNGSSSGTVTVNTAAAAGTWTLTLPTSAGTNGYVLSTDGAGVTSWVAQSGGGGGVTSFSAGTTGLTPNTATTGAVTLAGTLAVANGGTGVTTSTGTGSVVLSNSPALGSIGIGTSAATAIGAVIGGTLSGSSSGASIQAQPTIGSGITGEYTTYKSRPITQAATFTLANMVHFYAQPQAKGAGSTITAQYGFLADSGMTDATITYGFYSGIASGTNRFGVYMAGTAVNYFGGLVRIGSASAGDQQLNVNGAVRVAGATSANQTSAGTMDFNTASNQLRFLSWGPSGTQGSITWWTGAGAASTTQRMTLNGSNNL